MPGRLQTPQDCYLTPGEPNLRKRIDAINSISQQAFSPRSYHDQGTNNAQDFNSTTYVVITGMSIPVAVPVPSRVILQATLRVECTTFAATEAFQFAFYLNGTRIQDSVGIWEPTAVDARSMQTIIFMQSDLVPETLYTYDVRARNDTGTTGVYQVNGTKSSLIIRTEGRQRI